jgi:hypothetical protein
MTNASVGVCGKIAELDALPLAPEGGAGAGRRPVCAPSVDDVDQSFPPAAERRIPEGRADENHRDDERGQHERDGEDDHGHRSFFVRPQTPVVTLSTKRMRVPARVMDRRVRACSLWPERCGCDRGCLDLAEDEIHDAPTVSIPPRVEYPPLFLRPPRSQRSLCRDA